MFWYIFCTNNPTFYLSKWEENELFLTQASCFWTCFEVINMEREKNCLGRWELCENLSQTSSCYYFKEGDEDNTQREEQRPGPLTVPQQVRKKPPPVLFPSLTQSNYCQSLCPSIILFREAPIHMFWFRSDSDIRTLFFKSWIILLLSTLLLLLLALCVWLGT